MVTGWPRNFRLSPRAREFYSRVFAPACESLQSAVDHTPLVIMLWGPRQRSREWSRRRMHIRETLEQRGHTAFFSEQLGVPIDAGSKKGVEFLQSEATDLIVVIQPLYALVGSVRHFVEFRVVDAKMLLFVEESAADQPLYARALAELDANYKNVETFSLPEDASPCTLLDKILDQVRVMQMVKYRAIQSSRNWGLGAEDYALTSAQPRGMGQPFRYNLLELYREHRSEIDVLTNPVSLFLLAFVYHIDKASSEELSRAMGLLPQELSQELGRLQSADLVTKTSGMFEVTGFGNRLLDAIGFAAPSPKVQLTVARPMKWERTTAWSAAAGVGLAAVILASLWMLNGANVTQTQAPLELTPALSLNAPIKTITPTRAVLPNVTITSPVR